MELGMIGLGRMGANMSLRLLRGGHHVVGYAPSFESRQRLQTAGGDTADSLSHLVSKLAVPRTLWMMLPAGAATDDTLTALLALLTPGDTLIDGGNSWYQDTLRRAQQLRDHRLHALDCGTSGGVWGLGKGYSLMIGGEPSEVERLRPVFETLAPAPDKGWGRVGPSGAGHFTKMIHNGIEYGLMQAYAEGFSILQQKTEFGLDLHQIAGIWGHGSVVRSWLLELTEAALQENPRLEGIAPHVADSGEGRWAAAEAILLNVPAPVITLSLIARLRSRDSGSYADRLLAALRNQFGGHDITPS